MAQRISGTSSFTVDIDNFNLIEAVKYLYGPDDIFPEDELEKWAKDNGWEKKG
jgi:hypothetical protein